MSADDGLVMLYNADGPVAGGRGVLVTPQSGDPVAVVSPWPAALSEGTPFGVALLGPNAVVPRSRQPVQVTVWRLAGAGAAGTIGLIRFVPGVSRGKELPTLSPDEVGDRLSSNPDVASALAATSGEFAALTEPLPAAAAVQVDADARQVMAAPAIYADQGDAPTVALGICQIFHWD